MQTEQTHIPRSQLPRSLLGRRKIRTYTAKWKFTIGQLVVFGSTPAIVLERNRSAMGVEIYKIVCFDKDRPFRHVRGKAIDHTH
jgi:hypothetical protein